MRKTCATILIAGAWAAAQQPGASAQSDLAPASLRLKCDALDTKKQADAIRTDAFGYGNPTAPESSDETTTQARTVLVEIDGGSGRIHLPREFQASSDPGHPDAWWPIEDVRFTAGDLFFQFTAKSPGPQKVRVNRISGVAQLTGYGPDTLRATCHVQQPEKKF